ncbi:MAG: diguanylate cyclase [Magnetococcus sp. XQGC-1]
MLHTLKIGQKILLVMGVASAVIMAGMLYFYSEHERTSILEQNERARIEQMHGIVNGLKAIMIPGFASLAHTYAEQLRKVPGTVDLRIMRLDGREAFLDNETIEEVNWRRGKEIFPIEEGRTQGHQVLPANDPNLLQAITEKRAIGYEYRGEEKEMLQTFLIPIPNERECHLCHGDAQPLRGVVELTTSLAHVESAINDARRRAGVVLLVSLSLLLFFAHILIRKTVVQSIQDVDLAMRRVATGNLSLQVPVVGHDELSHMAMSFNSMVEQLLHTYNGLQAEQNKLSTIILSAREGIIVTDRHETVVLVNPAAERLLGKDFAQIAQEGFFQFMDDPDYVRQMIATGGVNMPDIVVYNERVLSVYAACIRSHSGEPIGSAALLRDVTEQKKLEETLTNLSYTDKLTGLFNRRRMEELLQTEFERARRYAQPLSFLLLDVDHFKRFNDQHGHEMGDRVLQAVGDCMSHFFRKTDFPCRYGGEEFCVILTNTADNNNQGASLVAERFRKAIEEMRIDTLQVTVSIGIAVMHQREYPSVAAMLKAADKALYRAKEAGRNRVMLAVESDK